MPLIGETKRKYQREWVAKRRAEFLKDKKCKCGSVKDLQIDHIDRSQKVSHNIWSWSKVRRDAELLKCQILCLICHRKKTREESIVKKHGLTMYTNHKCRCETCCQALIQHWKNYRARKKNSLVV